MLVKAGYVIKVINTINFKKSMHYNPIYKIDPQCFDTDEYIA